MRMPCGCTDLVHCEVHAERRARSVNRVLSEAENPFTLAAAFARVMFPKPAPGPADALAFSEADAAYLKKLRISAQ